MDWLKTMIERLIPPQPWTPALLSWVVVVAALAMYAQLLILGNPANLDDVLLGRILGTVDMAFGVVLAYWLGTSSGATRTRAGDKPEAKP